MRCSRWRPGFAVLLLLVGVPALAAHLRLDVPSTMDVGSASPPLTVSWVDATGAKVNAASTITVTLTSSSAGGEFSDGDNAAATWVSAYTTTIPAGTSTSAVFFYRDATLGAPTLFADGGVSSASVPVQLAPTVLDDDVESGTLFRDDSPSGAWSSQTTPTALSTLAASTQAAHRGSYGVRQNDQDPDGGSGPEGNLAEHIAPLAGNVYARTWVRVSPTSALGDMKIFSIQRYSGNLVLQAVNVSYDNGGLIYSSGSDVDFTYTTDSTGVLLTSGNWHLLEIALEGLNTPNGLRRFWFDGALVSSRVVDWTGWYCGRIQLGELAANNRSFTGNIDYDDVRVAVEPLASHFGITAPTHIVQGACAPVRVTLRDSVSGAAARAPHAVDASVSLIQGSGNLFTASDCTGVTSTASIASGQTTQTLYIQPVARGALQMHATDVDFLEGVSAPITVTGAPESAGFPDAPVTTSPDSCSPAVAVGLFDDAGTPVALTQPFTIQVQGSAPLFSDPTCASPIDAGVALPVGATQADLYFLSSDAGTVTITANASGLVGGSQNETVQRNLARITPVVQTVAVGTQTTLDASNSGASAVHYHWRELEGPTGVALSDAPVQTFTPSVPGDYHFEVVTEDAMGGLSDPATASVHVSGSIPAPPGIGGCSAAAEGPPILLAGLMLLLRRRRRDA